MHGQHSKSDEFCNIESRGCPHGICQIQTNTKVNKDSWRNNRANIKKATKACLTSCRTI